jgi:hypothetical protein
MSLRRRIPVVLVTLAAVLALVPQVLAASEVSAPLVCDKGPESQKMRVGVSVPSNVAPGAAFTVRLDGVNSGTVGAMGLNFVHDMASDYIIPTGTSYVDGSVRVVPDTGTENVRTGATAVYRGGLIRLTLPARVDNGGNYTPPSVEFKVVPTGTQDSLVLGFSQFRITANAMVIGDLKVTCNPKPRPFPLATIKVSSAAGS